MDAVAVSAVTEQFCEDEERKGPSVGGLQGDTPPDELTLPFLPNEVWDKILEQVTNLDDMRKVVNSSWEWRRILDSKRVLFLFPNVVPLLTKYLKRNDVLKCRRVCKSWEQGVDEYFESALNLAPYTAAREKQLEKREIWQQQGASRFPYTYYRGSRLIREELSHSRNPHIGRALVIEALVYLEDTGTIPAINEYLSTFGHRIKFLDECWSHRSSCDYTNRITEGICFILTHLPNLIQYRIRAEICRDGYDSCKYSDGHSCDSISDMQKLKDQNVLPKLQTLQLEVIYASCGGGYFLDGLLISLFSNQLGRLENVRWTKEWNCLDWSNLTDLRLYLESYENELDSLQQLNAPKLKKLHLHFGCSDALFTLQMLHAALKSMPNVESVGLIFAFASGQFGNSARNMQDVQFPSITNLTINNRPISNRVLQQFPSLRSLHFSEFLKWNIYNAMHPKEMEWLPDHEEECYDKASWKIVLAEGGPLIQEWYDRTKVSNTLGPFSLSTLRQISVRERKYFRDDMVKSRPISEYSRCLLSNDLSASEIAVKWEWRDFGYGFSAATSFFKSDNQSSSNLLYFHRLEATSQNFEFANRYMKKVSLFQEVFPTVQEIVVSHSPILKSFLMCFPNLKLLKIPLSKSSVLHLDCSQPVSRRVFCRSWHDPILYNSYDKELNVLRDARVGAQKRICESEVWNILPSLEKISVVHLDDECNVIEEIYVHTRKNVKQVN